MLPNIKQMVYLDTWSKNDFAAILAEYNSDIGDLRFFQMLLFKAVDALAIRPIPQQINLAIQPDHRNFNFTPKSLIDWARGKGLTLPESFDAISPEKKSEQTKSFSKLCSEERNKIWNKQAKQLFSQNPKLKKAEAAKIISESLIKNQCPSMKKTAEECYPLSTIERNISK
jgi:hypothetical protein